MLVRFGFLAVVVAVSIQGHHHHHHGGGFHRSGSFSLSSSSAGGGGPFLEHGLRGGGSGSFSGSGSFGGDLGPHDYDYREGSVGPDFEYKGGIDQLLHKFRQGIKGGGSYSGKFQTHGGGGGYDGPFDGSFSGSGSFAGGFAGPFGPSERFRPGQSGGEKEFFVGKQGHHGFFREHGSGSGHGLHSGNGERPGPGSGILAGGNYGELGASINRGDQHGPGYADLGLGTQSSGAYEIREGSGPKLNGDGLVGGNQGHLGASLNVQGGDGNGGVGLATHVDSAPGSQGGSVFSDIRGSGHNHKFELNAPQLVGGGGVLSGSITSGPGALQGIHSGSANNGAGSIGLGINANVGHEPLGVNDGVLSINGDRGHSQAGDSEAHASRPTTSTRPQSNFEGNNAGPVIDREGDRVNGEKFEAPWTLDLGAGAVIHGGGSGYQYDRTQSGGNLAIKNNNDYEKKPIDNGAQAEGSIHTENIPSGNIGGSLSGGNIHSGNIGGPLAGFGIISTSQHENKQGHGGLSGSIESILDGSLVGGNIHAGNIGAPGFGIKQGHGELGGSIGSTLGGNFGGSLVGGNVHAGNIPSGNIGGPLPGFGIKEGHGGLDGSIGPTFAGSLVGGNIHAENIPSGNIGGPLPEFGIKQGHGGLGGSIESTLDANFGGPLVGGNIHTGKIPSGNIGFAAISGSHHENKHEHGGLGGSIGPTLGGSLVGGNIPSRNTERPLAGFDIKPEYGGLGGSIGSTLVGSLVGGNSHPGNIGAPGFGIKQGHSELGGSTGSTLGGNFGGSLFGGNFHAGNIPSGNIGGPLPGFSIKQGHGELGGNIGSSLAGSLVGGNVHAGNIPSGNIGGPLPGFGNKEGHGGLDGSIGSTLAGSLVGGNFHAGNIPSGNIGGPLPEFGIKQGHGGLGGSIVSTLDANFGGPLVGGNIHTGKIPSGNIGFATISGNHHENKNEYDGLGGNIRPTLGGSLVAANIPSRNTERPLAGFNIKQEHGELGGSIGSTFNGNFDGSLVGGNIHAGTIPSGNIDRPQAGFGTISGSYHENKQGHGGLGGSIGSSLDGNFGGSLGGGNIHVGNIPTGNIGGPLDGFGIKQGYGGLGGSFGSTLDGNFGGSVVGGNIHAGIIPSGNIHRPQAEFGAISGAHENKPENGDSTGIKENQNENRRPDSAIHSENLQIHSGSIIHGEKEHTNNGPGGSLSIVGSTTAPGTGSIIHSTVGYQDKHKHGRPDSGLEGSSVGSFGPSGFYANGNFGQPNFGLTNAFGYGGNLNGPNYFEQNEFGLNNGGIAPTRFGSYPSTTIAPSTSSNTFGSLPSTSLTPTAPGLISVDGTIFKPVGGIIIRHKNGKGKEGSTGLNIQIGGNTGGPNLIGVHKETGPSTNGKIEGQGAGLDINIGNMNGKYETNFNHGSGSAPNRLTSESTLTGSTGGPTLNFGIHGDRRPVQSNFVTGSSFDGSYRLPTVNFGIQGSGLPEYNGLLTGSPLAGNFGAQTNYFGIHGSSRPVFDGSEGSFTEGSFTGIRGESRPVQNGQTSSGLSVGSNIKESSGAPVSNFEVQGSGNFDKKKESSGPGTSGIVVGSTGEPVLNIGINRVEQKPQNERPDSKTGGIVVGSVLNGNVGRPGTEFSVGSGSVLGDIYGNPGLIIASPNDGNTEGPVKANINFDQLSGSGSLNIDGNIRVPQNFAERFENKITGTTEKPFFSQGSIYPSASGILANFDGSGFFNGIISSPETPSFSGNLNFNIKESQSNGPVVNSNLDTTTAGGLALSGQADIISSGSKRPETNLNEEQQQANKNNKDIKNVCQNINIRIGDNSACGYYGIGNEGPSASAGQGIEEIKKENVNSRFPLGLGSQGGLPVRFDAGFDGTKFGGVFGNQVIGGNFPNQAGFDRGFSINNGGFAPTHGGFGFDAGFDGSNAGLGGGFRTQGFASPSGLGGFGNQGGFRNFGGQIGFDGSGILRQEPINQDILPGGPVGFYRHDGTGGITTERNNILFGGRFENQNILPGGPVGFNVEAEREAVLRKNEGDGTLNLNGYSNFGGEVGSSSGNVNKKVLAAVNGEGSLGIQGAISGGPIGIENHSEIGGGLGNGSILHGDGSFEASEKSSSSSSSNSHSSQDSVQIAKDLLGLLENGAADTKITRSSSSSSASSSASSSSSSSTSLHSTLAQ